MTRFLFIELCCKLNFHTMSTMEDEDKFTLILIQLNSAVINSLLKSGQGFEYRDTWLYNTLQRKGHQCIPLQAIPLECWQLQRCYWLGPKIVLSHRAQKIKIHRNLYHMTDAEVVLACFMHTPSSVRHERVNRFLSLILMVCYMYFVSRICSG